MIDREGAKSAGCQQANTGHGGYDRGNDQAEYKIDHCVDDHVNYGLVGRIFHQFRQANIHQIDSVKAEQSSNGRKRRKDHKDRRYPAGRGTIGCDLQGLDKVFLPVETGRECINDQGHHVDHDQRQDIQQHRRDNAEQAPAEHDTTNRTGDRTDSGQWHDIAGIERLDGRRFALDHVPGRRRLEQDGLHPFDQVIRILRVGVGIGIRHLHGGNGIVGHGRVAL